MEAVSSSQGVAELEWAIESTRSGLPTLSVGGRLVHSRYDPCGEAERLAEAIAGRIGEARADCLVLIGRGLDYLPRALRSRIETRILMWDPFPEMTRQLPLAPGPEAAPGIEIVCDADAFDAALGTGAGAVCRPELAVHPGYQALCRFEARYAIRALRHRLGGMRALAASQAIVSRRALDALLRLPYRRTIRDLKGSLEGHTVFLVSSGASIHESLDALSGRRGGVVIAGIRALRILEKAGVEVDIAVCTDPQDLFSIFDSGSEPRFRALLADTSCHPRVLDRQPDRTFLFHLRTSHLHQIPWEACGLPVLDEPFVTVSETALVLAHRLGARRLLLAGFDFASQDARYSGHFRTRNLAGDSVSTNPMYFQGARYLDHLCPHLAREGCEIRRLGRGLAIGGTQPIASEDLAAWIAQAIPCELPALGALPAPDRLSRSRALLRTLLKEGGGQLRCRDGDSAIGRQWSDFEPLPRERAGHLLRETLERLGAGTAPRSSLLSF